MLKITIDKTKVQGTNVNFPYLFSETTPGIPTSFWSGVTDINGLDIRFFADDLTTELKREVAMYDSVNHKVECWVQVPSLSSASDTIIYCQYGVSTKANDTLWSDIGADNVFHLQKITSGNAIDSFNYANDLPNTNSLVDAKIHNGAFIESSCHKNQRNALPIWTMSIWDFPVQSATAVEVLMQIGTFGDQPNGGALYFIYNGAWSYAVGSYNYMANPLPWFAVPDWGVPYHIVATYDGTQLSFYVNGNLIGQAINSLTYTPDIICIGGAYSTQYTLVFS